MTTDPGQVRRRAGLFIFISFLVAAGTAFVGYSLVARHEARLVAEHGTAETVRVVVAKRDIGPGVTIVPDDVGVESRAADAVAADAIFESVDEVVGQTPRQAILSGEAIRVERLQVGPGGLEARAAIEHGSRAVTVRVDAAAGVGGLLEPGFCVDVIVTVRPEQQAIDADWVTETILQDVRVVAVEGASQPVDESGRRVSPRRELLATLEVGPEEAERLAMASSLGHLHLSLRHADDHDMTEHRGPLVTNAMVGLAATTKTSTKRRRSLSRRHRKADSPAATAEVIQGDAVDVEKFDSEGRKVTEGGRGRRR